MQRFFDILISGLLIAVLTPLLIPIIIFLKFSGEGEVFYLQERMGKGGNFFYLYKFATMLKNSPNMFTGTITVKDDPRILPAGRFLRNTKINELPQLLNIFMGHMSFIGPRPFTSETFGIYCSRTQNLIKQVRPGLSGIGSIIFRSEEEMLTNMTNPLSFYAECITPYKGLLEEWYVEHQSIGLYFYAIFVTAWVVVFPKSTIAWSIFSDLPKPPECLKGYLNHYKF